MLTGWQTLFSHWTLEISILKQNYGEIVDSGQSITPSRKYKKETKRQGLARRYKQKKNEYVALHQIAN